MLSVNTQFQKGNSISWVVTSWRSRKSLPVNRMKHRFFSTNGAALNRNGGYRRRASITHHIKTTWVIVLFCSGTDKAILRVSSGTRGYWQCILCGKGRGFWTLSGCVTCWRQLAPEFSCRTWKLSQTGIDSAVVSEDTGLTNRSHSHSRLLRCMRFG